MLTRRRALAAMVLAAGLILLTPDAGRADPPAECDKTTDPLCQIEDTDPGGPGDPDNGGGGGGGCTWGGQSIPCSDPDYGYYVGGGCYWKALVPQPKDAEPPPGKDPAKGKWGVRYCYTAPGSGEVTQVYQWMDDGAIAPTPEELAERALAKLKLRGAQIGVAPKPNGKGAVGLPVWLWTAVTPGTWGPQRASESAGAITVSIEAKAHTIVWDMGDGHSVTCNNPGTPYEAKHGLAESAACGYKYLRPSITTTNPNGRYTVAATTHWRVDWSGGGQTGVLTPTSQSQTTVQIGEIQVVKK
ncbi:hypothetical protein [Micromonospora sp. CPCC 206061]|uniref:hypothetical protein n=1 Tax=Micromonospora sp. CPCC 206061 TaxID=3122410 RepID=UPI002FF3BFD7